MVKLSVVLPWCVLAFGVVLPFKLDLTDWKNERSLMTATEKNCLVVVATTCTLEQLSPNVSDESETAIYRIS